ncbi:hypothetical protein [Antarctobacter heliothermus]|uniref:hypothetical protein n=1 Tax=Antarctobacter heliothermus TaxID=74033 RepID=UPI0012FE4337|nr:hypothetical protein [Antarctobacter heliothermus]
MDGSVEWTEMGVASGLNHLAMLSPIENFYQGLLPGFSSITTVCGIIRSTLGGSRIT